MLENLDTLSQQIAFNHYASELTDAGLDWLLQIARHWPQAGTHLEAVLLRAYFDALIRKAYEERPPIRYFDGGKHERDISQFRDLDRTLLQLNRIKLALRHWENLPHTVGGGQLGVLAREFEKRARHLPIRQLMTRAGLAIQVLKPVFMMSPLSIASYLPPGSVSFDLVVFDEASQVKPVDALGAIARGRQLVVVGDSKQLPPTRFFDTMIGDGDEDEEVESVKAGLESILNLIVSQGAPQRMIRWHYRSRHESLIAFSNYHYYGNRLLTFPSPHQELGVSFRNVTGEYDKGKSRTNRAEATAVVSEVLTRLLDPKQSRFSIGIVTFSQAQQQLIDDLLALSHMGRSEIHLSLLDMQAMVEAIFMELTTPESRQRILSHINKNSTETYEIELLKADGSTLPVETYSKDLIYEGKIARLVSMRDITRRKQAELQLTRQFENLNVLHAVDQAVATVMDLNLILKLLVQKIIEQIHVDACAVLLLNPQTQTLDFAAKQ
ncbi:MAG: PAS domain S-box protein, partial [Azonexaceae bacterium]|nr:PAS domain S-box protein [Azonexaceae bacterium]